MEQRAGALERHRHDRLVDWEPSLLAAVGVIPLRPRFNQEVLDAHQLLAVEELQRRTHAAADDAAFDPGLLARLAKSRLVGRLARFHVTFGKDPDGGIFLRPNEQDRNLVAGAAK